MEESNDFDVSPCPGASPEVNKPEVTKILAKLLQLLDDVVFC